MLLWEDVLDVSEEKSKTDYKTTRTVQFHYIQEIMYVGHSYLHIQWYLKI